MSGHQWDPDQAVGEGVTNVGITGGNIGAQPGAAPLLIEQH